MKNKHNLLKIAENTFLSILYSYREYKKTHANLYNIHVQI